MSSGQVALPFWEEEEEKKLRGTEENLSLKFITKQQSETLLRLRSCSTLFVDEGTVVGSVVTAAAPQSASEAIIAVTGHCGCMCVRNVSAWLYMSTEQHTDSESASLHSPAGKNNTVFRGIPKIL